jgi:hypothetical protein
LFKRFDKVNNSSIKMQIFPAKWKKANLFMTLPRCKSKKEKSLLQGQYGLSSWPGLKSALNCYMRCKLDNFSDSRPTTAEKRTKASFAADLGPIFWKIR